MWTRLRSPQRPLLVLGFAVAYFVSNELSFVLELREAGLAVLWPGSGLAVAALLIARGRDRHWIVGTLLVGNVVANSIHGRPLWLSVAFALSNSAETMVCVQLYARSARGRVGLARWGRLLVGAVAGALVGALTGGFAVHVAFGAGFLDAVQTWFIADGVGILIVAPMFLVLDTPGADRSRRWHALEMVFIAAFLAASVGIAFGAHNRGLAFVVLPPLLMAGLRTSARYTARLVGATALVSTMLTLHGRGAFAFLDPLSAVQTLQVFIVVLTIAVVSLAVAVSESRAAHAEVATREALFRQNFDDSLLGMLLLDFDPSTAVLRVARANPPACRIIAAGPTGWAMDERLPDDLHDAVTRLVEELVRTRAMAWTGELELDVDGGHHRWMDASLSVLATEERSRRLQLALQVIDITGRRQAERKLTDMAMRDDLTGLANRAALLEHLQLAIDASEAVGLPVAALFVDLDDFKTINDGFGHHAGDDVLREVARRLQSALRPDDLVARIGGDEFVVVCTTAGVSAAERVGERLLARLREPIEVGERRYAVNASVGVSVADTGDDAITMLRQADTAMYAAKREGKGRVGVFAEEMHVEAERRAGLVPRLQAALRDGELRLHYQPIVDLRTDSPIAVEALIRWQHPERGLLPPVEWLDVVERSDLVNGMGRWVLEEACRWGARWQRDLGTRAPSVHVNVSARHLNHPSFGGDVRRALDASGFSAAALVLEVTETHLLTVSPELRMDLERLRLLGVRISADDFGTGFSALSQVIELEVDSLKIDRSFVMAMDTSGRARAVVHAVAGLGRALDIEVVAEGVESREHAEALLGMGCPSGQGYLWSKARPPEEIGPLLQAWDRRSLAAIH